MSAPWQYGVHHFTDVAEGPRRRGRGRTSPSCSCGPRRRRSDELEDPLGFFYGFCC